MNTLWALRVFLNPKRQRSPNHSQLDSTWRKHHLRAWAFMMSSLQWFKVRGKNFWCFVFFFFFSKHKYFAFLLFLSCSSTKIKALIFFFLIKHVYYSSSKTSYHHWKEGKWIEVLPLHDKSEFTLTSVIWENCSKFLSFICTTKACHCPHQGGGSVVFADLNDVCVRMLSCFSHVLLFETLWTEACQAPLSMGFSKQEYWSGLPCPPPGDLPDLGMEPTSLMSSTMAGEFFTTSTTWEV